MLSYCFFAFFHSSSSSSICSLYPSKLTIESTVIRGPNLPVKARPSFALVDMWTTGTLYSSARLRRFWIWSSVPLSKLFLSMFKERIRSFDFFFSNLVHRVLLHSWIPAITSFFAFSGWFIFFIACLKESLFTILNTLSSNSGVGTLSTHSLKLIPLYWYPLSFPTLLYLITFPSIDSAPRLYYFLLSSLFYFSDDCY